MNHRLLAACVVVVGFAGTARADILYGVKSDALFMIDTDTVTGTFIGSVGYFGIGGLAFGNDGTLYGIASANDRLIRIDILTGAGSSVGATGRPISFTTGLGNDPTTDTLYGNTEEGFGQSSFLVTYSKANGSAATVGDTAASALVGLDFDSSGQLWGIDGEPGVEQLVRINKFDGSTTVIGPGGLLDFPSIAAFDIGASGTFWAIHDTDLELLSINPSTGLATSHGNITGIPLGGFVTGLASLPGPGSAYLLCLGSLVLRRRRR
ncbi:MAG: hypothetical protein E2O40_02150 [Planctomycetota bacterium]|nr:MAG: hypothetical protein E2O40_02150 [Planctomycetota bacterium]